MFVRRGNKIIKNSKTEDEFRKDYVSLTDFDGIMINDYFLWKKFISLKKKPEFLDFLGKSFQQTDDYKQEHIEDSYYYIEKIDKQIKEDIKKNPNESEFEFQFYPYNEIILKLWRELLKDSIVFLKESDKREDFHDWETFGVDELYMYFKRFIEFEEVLYENIPYYRDHVFHVFRVFLLGIIFLTDNKNKRLNELKIYQDEKTHKEIKNLYNKKYKTEKIINDTEKIVMWTIISLTHDLGYPLEKLAKINDKVREMLEAFGRSRIQEIDITFPQQGNFINDFILKFISSRLDFREDIKEDIKEDDLDSIGFKLHVQSKYWLKLSRAFEEYDHGIVSCILLMKYLVYFLESDFLLDEFHSLKLEDQKQFQIRREILRSIAVHNCNDIYHLDVKNFQFLLTFIDELQCWGRPSGRLTTHTPGWKVKLIEFSENYISYAIITRDVHKDTDFRSIFLNICKKYTKIFRGAVDGKNRIFNVHFKLLLDENKAIDCVNSTEKKTGDQRLICLEYHHIKPDIDSDKLKDIPEKDKYYIINVNEYFINEKNKLDKDEKIPYHAYVSLTKDNMNDTILEIKNKKSKISH